MKVAVGAALFLAGSLAAPAMAGEILKIIRPEGEPLVEFLSPLVLEAYKQAGLEAEIVAYPGVRALWEVDQSGTFADIVRHKGFEKVHPSLTPIPIPLVQVEAAVYATSPRPEITNLKSLKGHSICLRSGIKGIEAYTAQWHTMFFDGYGPVFSALKAGRCDLAVLPWHSVLSISGESARGIHLIRRSLVSFSLFHFVRRDRPEERKKLEISFRKMRNDGRLRRNQSDFEKKVSDAEKTLGISVEK